MTRRDAPGQTVFFEDRTCLVCGRPLRSSVSIVRGYGRACGRKLRQESDAPDTLKEEMTDARALHSTR